MGIISTNKTIMNDVTSIGCNGEFDVKISLSAMPSIMERPVDIALLLDRSRSMAGAALANLISAVEPAVDTLARDTGGNPNEIGGGSRVGIISFATFSTADQALTNSVPDIKAAVQGLTADGFTNHGAALAQARDMLADSTNEKMIVMVTDGNRTTGPDPLPIAAAAKEEGISIYCIGLMGQGGLDVPALEAWVSEPVDDHLAIIPDNDDIEALFEGIAENLTNTGATNIEIIETLADDFEIALAPVADKGSVSELQERSFKWTIDALGAEETEYAEVTFTVRYTGSTQGLINVNQMLEYSDSEQNEVDFGNPLIYIICDSDNCADSCPTAIGIDLPACEEAVYYHAGEIYETNTGRILELSVTLKSICPGKRVALAVILTEEDAQGVAQPRGMKTFIVGPHDEMSCADIEVECIRFILPDTDTGICDERRVAARFISHYIDSDFVCMQ